MTTELVRYLYPSLVGRQPSGVTLVRGPITPQIGRRLQAAYDGRYTGLVLQAIAVHHATPRPDSIVVPEWAPVRMLVDLFDQHGVPADVVAAVLWRLERDDLIVQRTMAFGDGQLHPVAKLTGLGHTFAGALPAGGLQIPPYRPGLAPTRPELNP